MIIPQRGETKNDTTTINSAVVETATATAPTQAMLRLSRMPSFNASLNEMVEPAPADRTAEKRAEVVAITATDHPVATFSGIAVTRDSIRCRSVGPLMAQRRLFG